MALHISKKGLIITLIALLLILTSVVAGVAYYIVMMPNTVENSGDSHVYIRDHANLNELMIQMEEKNLLKNPNTFRLLSKWMKFDTQVRPGRFKIEEGISNLVLIRRLRSGVQDPIQLRFHNIRTKEQFAGRISSQIMADSLSILNLLNDENYLKAFDLTPETAVALFIPNTYEVFWNLDAERFFQRMKREYDLFWNESRKAKAAAIPLTPVEVAILASIIEEESNKKHELPIIAGLYINRLRIGMPLQACPTVKFALNDFTLQRILYVHLEVESPYNTYRNKGLPPGPIRIPSIACLDAVLNYEKHDYLFMTAKETLNGEHNFARTGAEHARNARRYQQALNQRGIR